MDADGFVIVKTKKRGSKKVSSSVEKRTTILNTNEGDVTIDKEVVLARVQKAKDDLKDSLYFKQFLEDFKDLTKARQIDKIYCFGLGHFSDSVTAKYQFALLLCISEALELPRSEIFLCDPIFYKDEVTLLESEYSVQVIKDNIECLISCESSYLIILPHCPAQMTNNLLFANWRPGSLQNLILFANSVSNTANRPHENLVFIDKVVENGLLEEFPIKNSFKFQDIFNDMSLHKFKKSSFTDDSSFWDLPKPVYESRNLEFITK